MLSGGALDAAGGGGARSRALAAEARERHKATGAQGERYGATPGRQCEGNDTGGQRHAEAHANGEAGEGDAAEDAGHGASKLALWQAAPDEHFRCQPQCDMSHVKDFSDLDRTTDRKGAQRTTHLGAKCHARVAAAWIAVIAAGMIAGGCATVVPVTPGIDVVDGQGNAGTLGGYAGQVIILDVCASWAPACSLNARVLDEAAKALEDTTGTRPTVITILLDEETIGREAIHFYQDKLGVTHPVVLAGPRIREGTSALGPAGYVPRVVVIDKKGVVQIDDAGGVLSVQGLVTRVRSLL